MALGTFNTQDSAVESQARPKARTESGAGIFRQSEGRSFSCSIENARFSGRIAGRAIYAGSGLAWTSISRMASEREEAAYTIASPFLFHRPPKRRAPSPENADSTCFSATSRQIVTDSRNTHGLGLITQKHHAQYVRGYPEQVPPLYLYQEEKEGVGHLEKGCASASS